MANMTNNRPVGKNSAEKVNVMLSHYTFLNMQLKERVYFSPKKELTDYEKQLTVNEVRNIEFAFKFYTLSTIAVDIIMYLHTHGGIINGGYSDLTVALGRTTGPKGQVPNIRQMCLKLAASDIIYIDHAESKQKVKAIRLNPHWTMLI